MPNLKKNRFSNWFYYRLKRLDYGRNYKNYWEERGKTLMKTEINNPISVKYAQFLGNYISNLQPTPESILEYGCGYGGKLTVLEQKFSGKHVKLFGVDISSTNLDNARSILKNTTLKLVDGVTIPYDNKQFDLSFTASVLQHVPEKDFSKICNELIRVTKHTIIHVEAPVAYTHKFPHKYDSFYKDKGFKVKIFTKPDIDQALMWYKIDLMLK